MNIIFFGSSEFSLGAFTVCRQPPHRVLLVVTTPDKKKGRGLKLTPTAVRVVAEEEGIPVTAPENLKSGELAERVQAFAPEVFVVSSYGKIIPTAWLAIPSRVALNVHPSLLPRYRGAAPLHWPIIHGDKETGVSIAEVTARLDAGDIFHQIHVPIGEDMDSEMLTQKLAGISGEALRVVLEKLQRGETLQRTPQVESLSSYARKLKKEDGVIVWQRPATELGGFIRGLLPWPIASSQWRGASFQILKAHPESIDCVEAKPGQVLAIQDQEGWIRVQTGEGALAIEGVRPAGKKTMRASDFARGHALVPGSLLGAP